MSNTAYYVALVSITHVIVLSCMVARILANVVYYSLMKVFELIPLSNDFDVPYKPVFIVPFIRSSVACPYYVFSTCIGVACQLGVDDSTPVILWDVSAWLLTIV